MKSYPAAWDAGLQSGDLSLVSWWKLTRGDGTIIRGTENTRDLTIVQSPDPFGISGTYSAARGMTVSNSRATSDLSVDNAEVRGALQTEIVFDGIRAADLEAGLFDKAVFSYGRVDWKQPEAGAVIDGRGWLGNIKRDTAGNWTCELRKLAQALSQRTGRGYGVLCDATLGDARCGVVLANYTATGTVTGVTSRRVFEAMITEGAVPVGAGGYVYGLLTWTSGANAGYACEVAQDSAASVLGSFQVFEAFPNDIAENDTFTVSAGCNKQLNVVVELSGNSINPNGAPTIANGRISGDCAVKFSNVANFRGFPNKPGPDTVLRLRTPRSKSGGGGGKK